jgi:hypothetical protein
MAAVSGPARTRYYDVETHADPYSGWGAWAPLHRERILGRFSRPVMGL